MYTPLIYFKPEVEEKLKLYLISELDNHDLERRAWVDNIKTWDNLYWAEPSATSSQGPLKFGANIIIPVIAIAVEMVQAKQIGKLFALEQFCAVTLPDQYADIDRDLERILDHEFLTTANIRYATENTALEFNKYGTAVMKNGYQKLTRTAVIYDENGEREEREVVVKQGLRIDSVQVANFLMPFYANDPQTSPWCGEEHYSNRFEVQGFVSSGLFYDDAYVKLDTYFSNLGANINSPSQTYIENKEKQENREPLWPNRVPWKEIWLSFDVAGNDEEREIVVYYHRDSNTILGARYNFRHDLSRPYFSGAYFPVEGRWPGIGLCKMGDQFQIEITTQHRQRIDAATLANLRMFKARKNSGISPNEPIFYGKIWMVDEMDDLDTIQTGEVYPSAYQNEQASQLWWQQRSTVNELSLGMPQVGTPGTAAAELARVQENNMRFDYTYNRLKKLIRDVCLDSICILGQFGVRHAGIYSTITNGQAVKSFLSLSPDLIKNEIVLKFDLAGQASNKLLDRATWTQLAGILTQYYTNNIQLAFQSGDMELGQRISRKAMIASTEALKQILESFDVRNIERIIITSEDINGGPLIQPASALPGIAGLIQAPGMGFVNPVNTTVGG